MTETNEPEYTEPEEGEQPEYVNDGDPLPGEEEQHERLERGEPEPESSEDDVQVGPEPGEDES